MAELAFINPVYAFSGLLVGGLVGLTGVGGGALMTPVLILFFGVHPATAVGTDLLFAAATKSAGSLMHGFNKNIDWKIVARLASGSLPATLLTITALSYAGETSRFTAGLISNALGVALVLSAAGLLLRPYILRFAARHHAKFGTPPPIWLTSATGLALGVLVSVSSVGAGALGTVALMLLYPRLATARIIGSDIAHAVPLTLIAGLGHWWLGSIHFGLLASLLCGSLPGVLAGSYATRFIPEAFLRPLLAATLLLVATRLLGTM